MEEAQHQATHNRYFDSFAVLTVDDALTYFAQAPERILSLMGRYCETWGAVPEAPQIFS